MQKSNTSSKSIAGITGKNIKKRACITCNTCNAFDTLQRGMSLIEILIVVGIFSVVGVLSTRAVLLTVTGGKKSETIIRVRENLGYSLSVIERQLRNANAITDCSNSDTLRINYLDTNGNAASFSCSGIGPDTVGYVASGSARLTIDSVDITACRFTCNRPSTSTPPSIKVDLEAQDANARGSENAVVSSSTEVFLRSY